MSIEEIAAAFVSHYYGTFDVNPQGLASLYQPQSVATWEGEKRQGPENIINKFISFGKVTHNIPLLTKDVQLGATDNTLILFVSGQLKIESNPPLNFSQVFQLVASGPGQYYVHNEIFRLSLA
uniref:Nuclear transport factor 2 n=2 Tax=Chromulina nebulosa TaxID=96789 RepID=A0A7S0T157_9STRA|mmetsp:Transcript_971/g.855  ORF Transcript_971/g.855 Transcript_971/m.855 type:complete len:123 (+) Transcript_971:116-484(+)